MPVHAGPHSLPITYLSWAVFLASGGETLTTGAIRRPPQSAQGSSPRLERSALRAPIATINFGLSRRLTDLADASYLGLIAVLLLTAVFSSHRRWRTDARAVLRLVG
jgi:hypothetical protein